jgi:hypothetical protein
MKRPDFEPLYFLALFVQIYTIEDLNWDAFRASHLIFKGNVADKWIACQFFIGVNVQRYK